MEIDSCYKIFFLHKFPSVSKHDLWNLERQPYIKDHKTNICIKHLVSFIFNVLFNGNWR